MHPSSLRAAFGLGLTQPGGPATPVVQRTERAVAAWLYRNLGGELFSHCSRGSGLGALGQHFVAFDLVIVNGHVMYHPPRGSVLGRQRLGRDADAP